MSRFRFEFPLLYEMKKNQTVSCVPSVVFAGLAKGEEGLFLPRSKYSTEVRSNHNFKGFKSEEPFFRTGRGR